MVRGRLSIYACLVVFAVGGNGKLARDENDNDSGESGDRNLDDSGERIGAAVTQVYRHPYAASLLKEDAYICSAVILNTYWLLTLTKCFDSDVISSYITTKNLGNFSVRVGSTYNNKGGELYKIKQLLNNFDMKVSAVKLSSPMEFNSRVSAVRIPDSEEDVTLGQLVSMVAWTPNGHMRIVNAPAIEPNICESYTRLVPGHYICIAGVQDPDRHFCRRDNGGAVIQNNTLLGVTSFIYSCGLYTKTHAFPRVPTIARWLSGSIWDENNRPEVSTTAGTTTTAWTTTNSTEDPDSTKDYSEVNKYNMFTLPFEPINLPLEPSGDNSVIPRMSLYESYLSNLARKRTSTTPDPNAQTGPQQDERKKAWLRKLNNAFMMMPAPEYAARKYGTNYDYER